MVPYRRRILEQVTYTVGLEADSLVRRRKRVFVNAMPIDRCLWHATELPRAACCISSFEARYCLACGGALADKSARLKRKILLACNLACAVHAGPWPLSGEVDLAEGRGNDPSYTYQGKHLGRDTFSTALHYGGRSLAREILKPHSPACSSTCQHVDYCSARARAPSHSSAYVASRDHAHMHFCLHYASRCALVDHISLVQCLQRPGCHNRAAT